MADAAPDCDCCFSEINEEYTVKCNGSSSHTFCYECVCSYMASGLTTGSMRVICIQKRACSGMLVTEDIIQLMRSAASKFEHNTDTSEQHPTTSTGTVVECSDCNKRIRKLAFYNYVSCECGTVVCYECGQDITMSIRRHPCGPTNNEREPRWFAGSIHMANPSGSRRSLSRSLMTSLENTTRSLVLHNDSYNEDTIHDDRRDSFYEAHLDRARIVRRH